MMKKVWKNRSGVSPVIATILMVAITVVLAAVLYVMVMGFNNGGNQTPNVSLGNRQVYATTGATDYEVYVISVSGGKIAYANVEVVVVSGPAGTNATTNPAALAGAVAGVGAAHTDLQAGDKSTVRATGDGNVVVMFRDKGTGASLGQTTISAVVA